MKDTDGFVRIPNTLIEHSDMTAHEILVYMVLLKYRNHRTGKCWPGLSTIADEARLSRRAVIRAIQDLENRSTIDVERAKQGDNKPNVYTVKLYDEKHQGWFATSAKGHRTPRRNLSPESRARFAEAARNRVTSASEALPREDDPAPSDSESPPSDSESPPLVTRSHPNKTYENKLHEQTLRSPFEERRHASDNVHFIEDHRPTHATDKQVRLLYELWIHATGNIPPRGHIDRWRELTIDEARDLIPKYYAAVERYDNYQGPEYGTPAYEALSPAGQAFADSGALPESVEGYGNIA